MFFSTSQLRKRKQPITCHHHLLLLPLFTSSHELQDHTVSSSLLPAPRECEDLSIYFSSCFYKNHLFRQCGQFSATIYHLFHVITKQAGIPANLSVDTRPTGKHRLRHRASLRIKLNGKTTEAINNEAITQTL